MIINKDPIEIIIIVVTYAIFLSISLMMAIRPKTNLSLFIKLTKRMKSVYGVEDKLDYERYKSEKYVKYVRYLGISMAAMIISKSVCVLILIIFN